MNNPDSEKDGDFPPDLDEDDDIILDKIWAEAGDAANDVFDDDDMIDEEDEND